MITTTPKPTPLVKRLYRDPAVKVQRMATEENARNLAPGFLDAIRAGMAGPGSGVRNSTEN